MTRMRRVAATVTVTGLCVGLAGCGGAEPSAKDTASSSPTASPTSQSPSPSTSPTSTPTQQPLSRFEGNRAVKVTRKWMAAVATSINDNDKSMKATKPYSTGDTARFADYVHEEFGLFYPGPVPFTPVAVRIRGNTATVPVCMWVSGWGQKRSTKLPAQRRKIQPVNVQLKKVIGAWKVDGLVARSGSCQGVNVKGVAW